MHAASLAGAEIHIDGLANDEPWSRATPVRWSTDFAGKPTAIETRARFVWSADALYALFELDGAALTNTDRSRPTDADREKLYEEDCVELFVTPDARAPDHYFEIELGPFGHVFDLEVHPHRKPRLDWSSRGAVSATRDEAGHHAIIEARFAAPEIAAALARPSLPLGLFRIEGRSPRRYLAWSPARTPKPDFHVPEAFGTLCLDP